MIKPNVEMKYIRTTIAFLTVMLAAHAQQQMHGIQTFDPVNFSKVDITDVFWKPN